MHLVVGPGHVDIVTAGKTRIGPAGLVSLAVAMVVAGALVVGCTQAPDDGASSASTAGSSVGPLASGSSVPDPAPTLTAEEAAYADVLAIGSGSADSVDEAQASCLSARWVRIIGVDAFQTAGLTPESLEADGTAITGVAIDGTKANAMADAFGECGIDLVALLLEGVKAGGIRNLGTESCIEQVLTEDVARSVLIESVTTASTPTLDALLAGCPGATGPTKATGLSTSP